MAHPWHHAVSSAKQFGGEADDYFEFHQWVDSTKSAHAVVTHRAVLHTREGGVLASWCAPSPPGLVGTNAVHEQHVEEDLGFVPALAQFLDGYDTPIRPKRVLSLQKHAELTHNKYGGDFFDHVRIHGFMDLIPHHDDPRVALVLHHAMGPYFAEKRFGAVIDHPEHNHTLFVRYVAEQHILNELGRIPSLSDWLAPMEPKPWMSGTRKLNDLYRS